MLCSTELPAVPALLLSLLPASALPAHLPLRPDGAEHPAAARAGLQSAPPPRLHDPVLYQQQVLCIASNATDFFYQYLDCSVINILLYRILFWRRRGSSGSTEDSDSFQGSAAQQRSAGQHRGSTVLIVLGES